MASLTRKPESRFWIACFTDSSGRQRQRSTKSTIRKEAQTIAEEFEGAYRRSLTESQARRVLSDIYLEIHRVPLQSTSISDYLASWLSRKAVETKKGTFSRYQGTVRKFLEFLGDRGARDLAFITSREVVEFRDSVLESLTVSSANTDLKILRVALQQAWKEGLIQQNPAAMVDTLKDAGDRPTRRAFEIAEVQKLLAVANTEWKGLILAGFYTGQRLGDLARLRWRQVDLVGQQIQFSSRKTARPMVIPIAPPLFRHFQEVQKLDRNPDEPLFPSAVSLVGKSGGETRRLSGQFYKIMVVAKIAAPRTKANTGKGHSAARKTNPLSFHSLRHTATSCLKSAGVSESVAMDIIGHDSKEISLNYTHIEDSAKRSALEKLPDIGGGCQ